METKINIAEILKNVPMGTKLYSPLFGNVYLAYIGEMFITVRHHSTTANFYHNGSLYDYEGTEPMLFPSREMRDWSKFTYKKGDVLISREGSKILFDKWVNEDHTKFLGKIKVLGNSHCYDTAYYTLVSEEEALEFIKSVEKINNGKLNRETLEIEKAQPEFKDGDVVVVDEIPFDLYSKCIFILKENLNTGEIKARAYVLYNVNKDSIFFDTPIMKVIERNIHLATDEEKQQLFDALAKEGKAWDAEKKQIVDLKPKVELKPFDKVLVRDSKSDNWRANLFGYIGKDGYYRCVYANWVYCIPYAGNEHLLGTTKNVEG